MLLFAGLVVFGPDQNPYMVTFLCALGVFQILEPKLPLTSVRGTILAYTIKLILCSLLIGQTDGIISRYYFVLVLPVISAATKLPSIAPKDIGPYARTRALWWCS